MNKEKLVDSLSLPKDITLGAPLINIVGTYEVYIQNYHGIIEYNENMIRFQTRSGRLVLSGNNLHIQYFTKDDVMVKGNIREVKFIDCG